MTTPEMKTLLPCPFCGSGASEVEYDGPPPNYVSCNNPTCFMCDTTCSVEDWQSRPTPQPSSEYVKAVEIIKEFHKRYKDQLADHDGFRTKVEKCLTTLKSHPTPAKEPSGELEKAVEARVFEICLKAVEDEKEFPGEPPSGFFDSIKNIPEVEKARIIVALTKSGIRTRIKALANFRAQVTKEGL